MLSKDRQIIQKLKRRISILIITTLALVYWIRINYLEIESYRYEAESLNIDLIESESKIKKLNSKLDSINKVKIQTIQNTKRLINNKIIIFEKKDTVIPQKIDSVPPIIIDTTSN
jgi:hypothetical protein